MKTILTLLLLILTAISCTTNNTQDENSLAHHHQATDVNGERYARGVNNGTIKTDTLKGSPGRTAMGLINGCHVHISYSSPGTKERVIWGGLVPLNQLWVTGAHQATKISFNRDVNVNGNRLKAGEYAFFTIPGKKEWTLIFNTRVKQHLTDDYNQKEDVLRFQVTPEQLPSSVQRLTYKVMQTSDHAGTVKMEWDKLSITFSITGIDVK